MRPVPVPAAVLACAVLAWTGGCGKPGDGEGRAQAARGSHTRVLELEIDPPEKGGLRVENLVGSFRVLPGEGDRIRVRATVHAGSPELAEKPSLEQVPGEGDGDLVIRVAYPLDEHLVYRYGESRGTGSLWLDLVGGNRRISGVDYAGRKVRVSNGRGARLHADVEVFLPEGRLSAVFESKVGEMSAENVAGELAFVTGGWGLRLRSVTGSLSARTRSGDMTMIGLGGALDCVTASGEVRIEEFLRGSVACSSASGLVVVDGAAGDLVEITTASGDVLLEGVSMTRARVSTASGDITSLEGAMETFEAETASGDIEFSSGSLGLKTVKAESVGGSIELLLDPDLQFQARAISRRAEPQCGFPDAEPVVEEGRVVGCRRGEDGTKIDISTGHGDIILAPIR